MNPVLTEGQVVFVQKVAQEFARSFPELLEITCEFVGENSESTEKEREKEEAEVGNAIFLLVDLNENQVNTVLKQYMGNEHPINTISAKSNKNIRFLSINDTLNTNTSPIGSKIIKKNLYYNITIFR
jgi:hypothetical protein